MKNCLIPCFHERKAGTSRSPGDSTNIVEDQPLIRYFLDDKFIIVEYQHVRKPMVRQKLVHPRDRLHPHDAADVAIPNTGFELPHERLNGEC